MKELIYIILFYTLIFSVAVAFLALAYFLIKLISIKKRELDLKEYELNISSNIEDDTFALLDKVIQECFTEYTVLNIEYRNDIDYVDADLEKIITQDVAHKVVDRISPTLISKISLVYNIDNFDKLLSERVYLFTMQFSIQKNSVKKEE